MKKLIRYTLLVVTAFAAGIAGAATDEEQRIDNATAVINELMNIPEQAIPPSLLNRAYGIAVIPNVIKAGFVVGARHGKGVLVIRQDDGSFSNPVFISMSGGSIGWQAGAQSSDLILVFKSRRGVDDITQGKLTLGADASVAAGPVGRTTSAATDLQFKAEVYSYSRSRGLFAGVSIDGSAITVDERANAAFYGSPSITADEILASAGNAAPPAANEFVQTLTARSAGEPAPAPSPADSRATESPRQDAAQPKPKVRTFGVPAPDEDGSDDTEVVREY